MDGDTTQLGGHLNVDGDATWVRERMGAETDNEVYFVFLLLHDMIYLTPTCTYELSVRVMRGT